MRVKFPYEAKGRKTLRTAGYGVFLVPAGCAPRMVTGFHGPLARVRARLFAARLNRGRG